MTYRVLAPLAPLGRSGVDPSPSLSRLVPPVQLRGVRHPWIRFEIKTGFRRPNDRRKNELQCVTSGDWLSSERRLDRSKHPTRVELATSQHPEDHSHITNPDRRPIEHLKKHPEPVPPTRFISHHKDHVRRIRSAGCSRVPNPSANAVQRIDRCKRIDRHRSVLPVLAASRIVAGLHGVTVANLAVGAMDPNLTATLVGHDLLGPALRFCLGLRDCARPCSARFDDLPPSILVRHNMPTVLPSHHANPLVVLQYRPSLVPRAVGPAAVGLHERLGASFNCTTSSTFVCCSTSHWMSVVVANS